MLSPACTLFKVETPPHTPIRLATPVDGNRADFLVQTVEQIDPNRNIGKVGDRFWGGQYQVRLTDTLDSYLESEVVGDLNRRGQQCYRYPGNFEASHTRFEGPLPLLLRLELQELMFSRHEKSHWFAEHVIGVCKIRVVVFDPTMNVLYQRQFFGDIDTHRPTDALVFEGIGLISRAGLSRMLSELLERTVNRVKTEAIPQILTVKEEYLEYLAESAVAEADPGQPLAEGSDSQMDYPTREPSASAEPEAGDSDFPAEPGDATSF